MPRRPAPLLAFLAALLGAIGAAGDAFAQDPPAVRPPELLEHVDPPFPTDAPRTDARVVLIVTVDEAGHVSDARVAESGGSAFDREAIVAVKQWRFAPAVRNDRRIAARIRVEVTFAAPPPPAARPAPASAIPTAEGPVETVEIEGTRHAHSRGPSDFRIGEDLLRAAPKNGAGDLLQTAPGFYVASFEGEAVAPRIFLRGFDADHGQDIELRVGRVPLNQSSHIHGQGYADLNVVIPEVVRELHVREGVYDPRQGDFAVAGSATFDLGVSERRSRVRLAHGSFSTTRVLGIFAPEGTNAETFGAASVKTTEGFGPDVRGATSGVVNAQLKLSLGKDTRALFTAAAHGTRANLAGVLRRDDIAARRVGFYDAYPDATARAQSAQTSRAQVAGQIERRLPEGGEASAGVYAILATFRSRTNFTGYLQRSRVEPTWVGRGDLFEQYNDDVTVGGHASYRGSVIHPTASVGMQGELGTEVRSSRIDQTQSLLRAPQNETWDERVDASVRATDVGLYADGLLTLGQRLRLRGGPRADVLVYDVDDRLGNFTPSFAQKTHLPGFRRTAAGVAGGPRATLEGTATSWLKLAASYGEGYRSPQARQLDEGEQAPFTKVRSFEAGATFLERGPLRVTTTAYRTDLSYDLAFDPHEARLERIGPTTRQGFVAYLVAEPTPFLHAALSATYVHATLDGPPAATPENPTPAFVSGQRLPYVPPVVVRSDVALDHELGHLAGHAVKGTLGWATTFLGPRPLPYGLSSPSVFLVDARASVRRDFLELAVDAQNLLGREYATTEYAFVSNWQAGTEAPSRLPARHITAGAPRTVFASATVYF